MPGIAEDYDTGIDSGIGVSHGMYHYSSKAPSPDDLEARREDLESRGIGGIDVTVVAKVDDTKAIFFFDPIAIQLEFCRPDQIL